MLRRSSAVPLGFLLLFLLCAGFAQQEPPAATTPQAPAQRPRNDDSQFTFRKEVEEVILHATVVDQHQRLVTNLPREAFTVYEDGEPQKITSFRREDIPVSLGIVIDNSASMMRSRSAVNQAAINLVRASNPQDEVFIVNFADEYYLDQDFTSDVAKLKEALERISSRGGTALYDAVIASADHLKQHAKLGKRVLLVVTDGEDNASMFSLEQAIRRVQDNEGPTVYTIGIFESRGEGLGRGAKKARRALKAFAQQTGGLWFFPDDMEEVDAITRNVAREIRSQYTIGYKPSHPERPGYKSVRVTARAQGFKNLQVRTRSGYYNTPQVSSSSPATP
ncbi:MAG TPA: VWA domain-containing protein [Terriglobales bacterium]|nr:VWA domain-containing protein [Terriglobales bacterium]